MATVRCGLYREGWYFLKLCINKMIIAKHIKKIIQKTVILTKISLQVDDFKKK
jgi:hypothetical protein